MVVAAVGESDWCAGAVDGHAADRVDGALVGAGAGREFEQVDRVGEVAEAECSQGRVS